MLADMEKAVRALELEIASEENLRPNHDPSNFALSGRGQELHGAHGTISGSRWKSRANRLSALTGA